MISNKLIELIGNDFQKLLLSDYNVSLIPLKRTRSDTYSKKFRQQIFKSRRRIETTISQLSDTFNLQRVRAKSLWGLFTRIYSKLLVFVISCFINFPFSSDNLFLLKLLAF